MVFFLLTIPLDLEWIEEIKENFGEVQEIAYDVQNWINCLEIDIKDCMILLKERVNSRNLEDKLDIDSTSNHVLSFNKVNSFYFFCISLFYLLFMVSAMIRKFFKSLGCFFGNFGKFCFLGDRLMLRYFPTLFLQLSKSHIVNYILILFDFSNFFSIFLF